MVNYGLFSKNKSGHFNLGETGHYYFAPTKNEKTLQEIASANNITPKNLQNWKKIFLDNAEIAMEPSKAVKDTRRSNDE